MEHWQPRGDEDEELDWELDWLSLVECAEEFWARQESEFGAAAVREFDDTVVDRWRREWAS